MTTVTIEDKVALPAVAGAEGTEDEGEPWVLTPRC
jgi:hypothetical protein